jgi:uncharacterized protein
MAIAPTYPGVYIEEIPSGVHTITGVGTSITAFVGYTASGSVSEPVHIFSFADFERAFGGLAVDSPLSYCVKHFFQNGGTEAYVVRVAKGAKAATVTVKDTTGANRILITAAGDGVWGNNLQVDVDYQTSNPSSLFNLTVTSYVLQNGELKVDRTETFRNLSMDPAKDAKDPTKDATVGINVVNAGSKLVRLALVAAIPNPVGTKGRSTSGTITFPVGDATHNKISVIIDGKGPFEATITGAPWPDAATLGPLLQTAINNAAVGAAVTVTTTATTVTIESNDATPTSSVEVSDAATNNVADLLALGLAHGGIETTGVAAYRPRQSGTVGGALTFPIGTAGRITITPTRGGVAGPAITIKLWDAAASPPIPEPATRADLVTRMQAALQAASLTQPALAGSTVSLVGGVLHLVPGPADPNVKFVVTNAAAPADNTATQIGLVTGTAVENVGHFAPGIGLTDGAQVAGAKGVDGSPPDAAAWSGINNEAKKGGIYALADVDLFNLLVMPDATASKATASVVTEAIAYCVRRRAFMIIDAPEATADFAAAQAWISGDAAAFRSRNSALYFPRLREQDPLAGNVVRSFPAAGALAGLYARTDAERGVWKAPAGTAATIAGATDGLSYKLTDPENGTLNPLALNCLRVFPVIGTVSWGARTGNGADVLADEYKYIPVRRLALYLEESLYRGTQWVVFEPNDEPLWAQIRLNVGAFMHELYAQGAFQGQTPRDAYFVRCDHTTTTQNDIDLGRVNIVIGFAPLKPAEFVIIQIQQIAGAIQT